MSQIQQEHTIGMDEALLTQVFAPGGLALAGVGAAAWGACWGYMSRVIIPMKMKAYEHQVEALNERIASLEVRASKYDAFVDRIMAAHEAKST